MKKLLLVADVPKEAVDRLSQVFDVVWLPNRATVADMLKGALGAQAVICDPTVKIESLVIDVLAPSCRIISVCGNECMHIDIDAATKNSILVCTSTSTVSDSVADMIFALLFAAGRRIIEGNEYVSFGRFRGLCPNELYGEDVSLKTLGIIGKGDLSRAVCLRAKAFNMKVFYASGEEDSILDKVEAKRVTLNELLAFSDYVTIHDEYRLTKENFDIMKSSGILINAVNTELVDENDLVSAIKEGKIKGAALDVFSKECAKELSGYDNCILTPNMGSATLKKRNNMINDAIRNVLDYFDGNTLQGIVNEID